MIKYTFKADEALTIKAATKANAQRIGEALAKISGAHKGKMKPKHVVDAARDPKHALHRHFEWKDAVAAEKYRLDQARSLIRSIHVEYPEVEGGTARAFYSIRDDGKVAYQTLATVLTSADLQSKVLAAAERDLLAFEARYRSLSEICDRVREVREHIAARRARAVGQDQRVGA